MGNIIAFHTGATPSGTIRITPKLILGLNPDLNASGITWWNSVSLNNNYIIYSDQVSQSPDFTPPDPVTAWSSDNNLSSLLNTINRLPQRRNQTPFTGSTDALSWLTTDSRYGLVNINYPTIPTQNIRLLYDSGFASSYYFTGNTIYDVSGNGPNGTLLNGVGFSPNNGGTLTFDATSSQYITAADLGTMSNFTVSAWFKFDSLPSNNEFPAVITNTFLGGSYLNFAIGFCTAPWDGYLNGGFYSQGWKIAPGFLPSTGVWYNVTITYDGNTVKLYKDRNLQSQFSTTASAISSDDGIRIGRRWDDTDYIDGEIPISIIYDRALSEDEVYQIYDAYQSRFIVPTPTPSPTVTVTPSITPSVSLTPSITPSITTSVTPTITPTITPTSTVTPTVSPTPNISTNGLIINLDANNSTSYPGTGTTVYNLQSGSYNHTLNNVTYTVLNGIKCFDANGVTAGIQVSGTGPTLPTTGYTYVTWARIKTSSVEYRTLFRTSPNDHPILVQVGTDNLGFWDNDGANFIDSGYDVTLIEDVWVQYAVVGDSSSSTFYINGTQVGNLVNYGAGGNNHNFWGGLDGQPFGYVANMFFYNRKLSQSEITQNYNFLSPRFV